MCIVENPYVHICVENSNVNLCFQDRCYHTVCGLDAKTFVGINVRNVISWNKFPSDEVLTRARINNEREMSVNR